MKIKTFFNLVAVWVLYSTTIANAQIKPATNRIAVDINMPQNKGYDSAFALGTKLGMTQMGLSQTWTAIETSPNKFDFWVFDIANIYYPAYNIPIDLTIAPINTNRLEVPSDLTSKAFNNPVVIGRFKTLLDSIKKHAPKLKLSSLVIGSESDVYLGNNSTKWAEFNTFYDSVSTYAKTLWPGLKVASELTFNGMIAQNVLAQKLNANSDYIGVSHYPLNSDFTVQPISTIPSIFDTIVALYPKKPICFYQYGYPSSASCKSSEELQRQFIAQTFTTWDKYAANIKMIDFTWLHDLDTASVSYNSKYYGIKDTSFLEFLHTLGLREWFGNGKDKPAFLELECQAKQRGYNNLKITCVSGINDENTSSDGFTIYPNPATENLTINFSNNQNSTEGIQIYNAIGVLVMEVEVAQSIQINTIDFAKGLYFICLKNHPEQLLKFIRL
ncbi:MAG: T9SS type A sorting domain-containing protein [Bacteroidetes bacterium]|nr:T9SS type A sorting domain-containing protein [Bacteroidota bacterium]